MTEMQHKFDSLVRTYHGDLYRFALFLSKNDALAQDVVQEVYLRAWKNIHNLREMKAAKSWLFTIASRENARYFARKKMEIVDLDEVAELSTDDNSEQNMNRYQLQKAMRNLEVEYREPILLQIIAGFSTSEIAVILKLNENTVSTRLFRARNQLKQVMASDSNSVRPSSKNSTERGH